MASSMVIKVKYGDMLRRFNASVNGGDQLDLDMAGLKAKVSSLFTINPEADFSLTYVDEDGDVVALIDDDDLRDVMRQQLKFLRINVQLNNSLGGRSYARSTGSSTPLRSPRDPSVLNLNRAVTDAVQVLPEALQATLLKLSADLTSKATTSSSIFAEIADAFAKIGVATAFPDSHSIFRGEGNAGTNASEIPKAPAAYVVTEQAKSSSKAVPPRRPTVDLNKLPADCELSEPANGKQGPASVCVTDDNKLKKQVNLQKGKSVGVEGSGSSSTPEKHIKLAPPIAYSPNIGECPFFGLPVIGNSDNTRIPLSSHLPVHPFKRHHAEAGGGIFHRGIRCDGCGIHPITGCRFKSKVKEDFDLCSGCFEAMGTEADYVRIDRPVSFRHPQLFKVPNDQAPCVGPPVLPRMMLGCRSKSGRSKLDSRFILDVNVVDGTVMPPSAPFTKIWRMRNNGDLVWPRGTQLLWIGGDKFSESLSVEMEIPENGVPTQGELDVAVDFIAPGYPGRYISYWRMSSPTGQKFGQRVWALIQVDASLNNSFPSTLGLKVNFGLPSFGTVGPKPVEAKDMECNFPKPAFTEPENTMIEPKNENEENFPINDSLLVGHSVSAPPAKEVVPSVSYPIIDLTEEPDDVPFFETAPALAPYIALPPVGNPTSSAPPAEGAIRDDLHEESLLRELEEMGFKEIALNKEILRRNEYNLEQSLDDLCAVNEWDPMLDELEEMGFSDTEMNKKLLAKNNGSIKRVVMDLINGVKM